MALDRALVELLRTVDTPTVCNALEIIAPENQARGFTVRPFVCADPQAAPIVATARTARIRAAAPAKRSASDTAALHKAYYEYMATSDELPTVAVILDADTAPGRGAFWGEVNSAIHLGLGVAGCITNGSMRDLDDLAPGFQILAGSLGPSHAYVHVENFGEPVDVHGMAVEHGDLVHADKHGAVVIPPGAISGLANAIDVNRRREKRILDVIRRPGFTLAEFQAAVGDAANIH